MSLRSLQINLFSSPLSFSCRCLSPLLNLNLKNSIFFGWASWHKTIWMKTVVNFWGVKKKVQLFSRPFPFTVPPRIEKKTSFWSSHPSGWLQAVRENFTRSLINIQSQSRTSLGHLVVNVAWCRSGGAKK